MAELKKRWWLAKKELILSVYCSIIAGAIMIMLEMILVKLFADRSIWETPRQMAAIVMGSEVLESITFDVVVVAVAMLVHFTLSIIYGFIFSVFTYRFGLKSIALFGIIFGLILYLINFYGFVPMVFPWFAGTRNWIMILAHLAFGFTLGFGLKIFTRKIGNKKLEGVYI